MANALQELSDAMASTVETMSNYIVRVNGRRRLPATGIVWSKDGLIVTAHHVLEADEGITVVLNDGSTHDATLVGRDPFNDVALLKVDASLPDAPWAEDNALKVGNLVLALGRPGNQVQATLGVTSALVSGNRKKYRSAGKHKRGHHRHSRRHRHGSWQKRMGRMLAGGYIQTDVVMYPGFSGGPLVSGDGRIHGLNTSGFSRGVSMTLPVATIRKSVVALLEHGHIKQGYIGIGIQPAKLPENIASELEQETGLLVVSVEDGSPAQTSGFMVGDILVSLGGSSTAHVDELMILLSGSTVGESLDAVIVRGGERQTLSVTVGER